MHFNALKTFTGRLLSEVRVVLATAEHSFAIPPNTKYATNGILFVYYSAANATIHCVDTPQPSITRNFASKIVSVHVVGSMVSFNFSDTAVIVDANDNSSVDIASAAFAYNDLHFAMTTDQGVRLYNVHTRGLSQVPDELEFCQLFGTANYRTSSNGLICTVTGKVVADLDPSTTVFELGSSIVIDSPDRIDNARYLGEISPGNHQWQNLAQASTVTAPECDVQFIDVPIETV